MKALIVIPARMGSTRFYGKPLAKIKGKEMIRRIYQIAKEAKEATDVVIATDDTQLFSFAKGFGAPVVMTDPNHLTGTDRVAEVMEKDPSYDIYFSLQGDAVLTPPWVIDQVLKAMKKDPQIPIATPAVLLQGQALADFTKSKEKKNSSGTCVVFDNKNRALYFSKELIPFRRKETGDLYRHIGLYGYRKEALSHFCSLPESRLEKAEGLEQLRALENGIPIQVVIVDYQGRTHGSVDKVEDVAIVEKIIEVEGELV